MTYTITPTQEDREAAVRIMADRWNAKHRARVLNGEADNWIPVQECALAAKDKEIAALRTEIIEAAVRVELVTTDPIERIIEHALVEAGIRYETDQGGRNPSGLDFHLLDYGVEIEVKRFHSERIAAQMARAENVIAVQGEASARLVADMIRSLGRAAIS